MRPPRFPRIVPSDKIEVLDATKRPANICAVQRGGIQQATDRHDIGQDCEVLIPIGVGWVLARVVAYDDTDGTGLADAGKSVWPLEYDPAHGWLAGPRLTKTDVHA